MADYETPDGGQLGEGVGPDVRREAPRKLAQHLVACVMAERHQKRAEKDLGVRPLQTRDQALRSAHEHVAAPALPKGALDAGERGLALRPAMPGKGHDATGTRGQGLVERRGHGRMVPLARKQGGARGPTTQSRARRRAPPTPPRAAADRPPRAS